MQENKSKFWRGFFWGFLSLYVFVGYLQWDTARQSNVSSTAGAIYAGATWPIWLSSIPDEWKTELLPEWAFDYDSNSEVLRKAPEE